jgi:trigger factor
MKKALDDAYRHAAEHANIPGFRKGKAPKPILDQHYGKEAIQSALLRYWLPIWLKKL